MSKGMCPAWLPRDIRVQPVARIQRFSQIASLQPW
jgi:hypothetical protein